MIRAFAAICVIAGLTGCTAHIVEDARLTDTISVYRVSCEKPYEIVRDCSSSWGPIRKIALESGEFNIGGSLNGDVILLGHTMSAILGVATNDGFFLGLTDTSGPPLAEGVREIESILYQENIRILGITPIIRPDWLVHWGSIGNTHGYFLVLDGNGYSILDSRALEDRDYVHAN